MKQENELLLVEVCKIAAGHGWSCTHHNDWLVSFTKFDGEDDMRMNVYWNAESVMNVQFNKWHYVTFTVQTTLTHPTKGRKQLNRKGVTTKGLSVIFDNPRYHTGKGYYKTNGKNHK